MPLTTIEDFFNELNVAQKSGPVADKLSEYIDMYEAEYIEGALGEDFAALFNANMVDERFATLEEMLKKQTSPIAAYIFYHYLRSEAIVASGSGDTRMKAENSSRSPESFRMRIAWNIMVDRTRQIQKYLLKNADTYSEFKLSVTNCELTVKVNDFGL